MTGMMGLRRCARPVCRCCSVQGLRACLPLLATGLPRRRSAARCGPSRAQRTRSCRRPSSHHARGSSRARAPSPPCRRLPSSALTPRGSDTSYKSSPSRSLRGLDPRARCPPLPPPPPLPRAPRLPSNCLLPCRPRAQPNPSVSIQARCSPHHHPRAQSHPRPNATDSCPTQACCRWLTCPHAARRRHSRHGCYRAPRCPRRQAFTACRSSSVPNSPSRLKAASTLSSS